jgi:uncharacterized membrane protein
VELALNLSWAIAALVLLGIVHLGIRRGAVRISAASAMLLAMLICLILLPAISASDDLLASRQAALPLSGQTWRVASEGISSGLDQLLEIVLSLLLLTCFLIEVRPAGRERRCVRPLASRLVRSLRLRPPPFAL